MPNFQSFSKGTLVYLGRILQATKLQSFDDRYGLWAGEFIALRQSFFCLCYFKLHNECLYIHVYLGVYTCIYQVFCCYIFILFLSALRPFTEMETEEPDDEGRQQFYSQDRLWYVQFLKNIGNRHPHSSPVRVSYGVPFVRSEHDLYQGWFQACIQPMRNVVTK